MLVGMRVVDEAGYTRYRAAMTPILESMGGFFRYDMRVSELLKGDAAEPFNRLFVLSFPDEATRDRFFSDPAYSKAKAEHFAGAVTSHTLIAAYATR
jgi:uncharacterized protein (DUF1330 family)